MGRREACLLLEDAVLVRREELAAERLLVEVGLEGLE